MRLKKALAYYYPHGLTLADEDENLCALRTLYPNCVGVEYKYNVGEYEKNFEAVKPILRHLSDLTKPIEHNGERFVPLEIIVAIALKEMDIKESDAVILSRMIMYNDNIHKIPFWCIQKLIEWKFDIFNLIGTDAIDVNTLEVNPYK